MIKNKKYLKLLIILLILIFCFFIFINKSTISNKYLKYKTNIFKSSTADKPLFPKKSTAPLKFPKLPTGSYLGVLKDYIPGIEVPIKILSYEDEILFFLGLDGWKPDRITKKNLFQKIIIKSNNIFLELKADQINKKSIKGNFLNLITNQKGSWEISIK